MASIIVRVSLRIFYLILLIPNSLFAQSEPDRPAPASQDPYGWWAHFSQPEPPRKAIRVRTDSEISWSVLEDILEEAADKKNPRERIYLLADAQKRLENYRTTTLPGSQDKTTPAVSKKLAEDIQQTLAEIRTLKSKEQESLGKSSPPAITLIELWKRIQSDKLPLSFTPLELYSVSNVKPFLSGPHLKDFDLNYIEDFGHYNPAFIDWAKSSLGAQNQDYFEITAPIVETHLIYKLEYLLGSKYYLDSNPNRFSELKKAYQRARTLKKPFTPLEEIPYLEGSYDGEFLAYWLRRDIDGTSKSVQELLELALNTYGPAVVLKLQRQYAKAEYSLTRLGTFHGDEVDFEDKQRVFLFRYGVDKPELKPDTVVIEMVEDPIMDPEGQKTGKTVSLASKIEGDERSRCTELLTL